MFRPVSLSVNFCDLARVDLRKVTRIAGAAVVTGIALYALSNLPGALAKGGSAYQFCMAACRYQYGDSSELISCFQRCRAYYGR